jgi:hypothetical protein
MIPECRCRYRNSKVESLRGFDRDIILAAPYLEVLQNKVGRLEGWLSCGQITGDLEGEQSGASSIHPNGIPWYHQINERRDATVQIQGYEMVGGKSGDGARPNDELLDSAHDGMIYEL